jgi:hypothetical protein
MYYNPSCISVLLFSVNKLENSKNVYCFTDGIAVHCKRAPRATSKNGEDLKHAQNQQSDRGTRRGSLKHAGRDRKGEGQSLLETK